MAGNVEFKKLDSLAAVKELEDGTAMLMFLKDVVPFLNKQLIEFSLKRNADFKDPKMTAVATVTAAFHLFATHMMEAEKLIARKPHPLLAAVAGSVFESGMASAMQFTHDSIETMEPQSCRHMLPILEATVQKCKGKISEQKNAS